MYFIREFFSQNQLLRLWQYFKKPLSPCLPIGRIIGAGLFILFFCVPGYAQENIKMPVTISAKDKTLREVFKELEQKTGFTINYQDNVINAGQKVSLEVRQKPFADVLQQLLGGTTATFKQQGSMIVLIKKDPAKVTGKVLDNKGEGLPGAAIKVIETNGGTQSGVDGSYTLNLQPGTYTLEISYMSFATQRITGVVVREDKNTSLEIAMKPANNALREVVVTSTYRKASVEGLLNRQKNNASVTDGISADQIARTPDNNAAQVLKRVSGLTVQDDKFVTIRGLSDRYNNVLLNGSMLPSTEPNRRNFAFDIVPAGLIDNIVVNKTATPDLPGEFAGGLVQVNTKDIPDVNYVSLTAGSGFNSNSTGKPMVSTPRGSNDFLGYDDGRRNWWKQSWDRETYAGFYSAGDYESMGSMNRTIPNNWGLYRYGYKPVQNYQGYIGRRIDLKNRALIGVNFAALFRHDETNATEERRTPEGDQYDFHGNAYEYRSSVGAVLNVAYQQKGNRITFKNLYNHLFTNRTTDYTGTITGFGNGEARSYASVTLMNTIWQHRLEGTHDLGGNGWKLDWSGDQIRTSRNQPDSRYAVGTHPPGSPENYYQYNVAERSGLLSKGSSLFNSRLDEKRYNWATNLTIPLKFAGALQKIKTGYAGAYRKAYFESLGMVVVSGGTSSTPIDYNKETAGLPEYELFAPENFRPGLLFYYPSSSSSSAAGEDYGGKQLLHAGYLMADLTFFKKLRLVGGLRVEHNQTEIQNITYQPVSGLGTDSLVQYNNTDLLPSANIIYSLSAKTNIRLAYSSTLSRPDFRERSSFIYYDFEQRTPYTGAVGLKDARIRNLDLRFEIYPSPGQVFSVSLFHKNFDSPVELVTAGNQGGGEVYYFFNLRSATASGLEVDFRKSLGFFSPGSWLEQLYINGNTTWIKGKVRYNTDAMLKAASGLTGADFDVLPPDSRNRPLQGLSPYVYNAGLGYTGKLFSTQLSYNISGPRIVAGGIYAYADQYEKPRHVIDLQMSCRFLKKKLEVKLNVADLLQQSAVIYQNRPLDPLQLTDVNDENINKDPKKNNYNSALDYTRYKAFHGTNFSMNITYNF